MNDAADNAASLRIDANALTELVAASFVAARLSREHAATMAETLVAADLRGQRSHGVIRLPFLIDRLQKGGANAAPDVRVVNDAPASALIDGDGGLGPVTACNAMTLAIDKARTQGVGFVAARNSDFIGTCAYYAMMALPHRMIGICWTNGAPGMAAWGGRNRTIGNNPIAFAAPGGNGAPIVLDMALSVAAGGRVRHAAKRGEKIPRDWVLDRDGNDTDDPNALANGGTLQPLGYKGYGLAVLGEILCGVLTGSNILGEVPQWFVDTHKRIGNGHIHIAIDIARFIEPAAFAQRIDGLRMLLGATPTRPGVDRVRLPGEQGEAAAVDQTTNGVELPRAVANDLAALANRLGVARPAFLK